jgi:hypothetical protein
VHQKELSVCQDDGGKILVFERSIILVCFEALNFDYIFVTPATKVEHEYLLGKVHMTREKMN